MNKRALSLLEIIISTVILSLVITGLVNVFVAGKQYIQHSRLRMGGGEIGKLFLDPLQAYIRQDTWNGSCFGNDKAIANCPNVPTVSSPYTAAYVINDLGADADIKKVKVTVTWPGFQS